jgi:hypothetical protein
MSSYGTDGFTAERPEFPGKWGDFGITLEDYRDNPFTGGTEEDPYPDFEISFPHQCDNWSIAAGSREHVLRCAYSFRDELSNAISALERIEGIEGKEKE